MLKMKIRQGVLIAENLKKRIRDTTTTITNSGLTPPSSTSSLASPSITHHDDRKNWRINLTIFLFFFVVDLNNDKELFDAYQHCLNGNQLVRNISQTK